VIIVFVTLKTRTRAPKRDIRRLSYLGNNVGPGRLGRESSTQEDKAERRKGSGRARKGTDRKFLCSIVS